MVCNKCTIFTLSILRFLRTLKSENISKIFGKDLTEKVDTSLKIQIEKSKMEKSLRGRLMRVDLQTASQPSNTGLSLDRDAASRTGTVSYFGSFADFH